MQIKSHPDMSQAKPGQIFVFGSNLSGIHGAGSARAAHQHYGAEWGVGVGPTGNGYALPTKDAHIGFISLAQLKVYVDDFIKYTKAHPNKEFFLTSIGTGLAGFDVEDVAAMFYPPLKNVDYPDHWLPHMKG